MSVHLLFPKILQSNDKAWDEKYRINDFLRAGTEVGVRVYMYN